MPVGAGEAGIWKVDMTAPLTNAGGPFSNQIMDVLADRNWNQASSNAISAWDVSVRNSEDTGWVPGRVYVNVLSLQLNSGYMPNAAGAFYGVNYVLTNDGYVYRVDANGSNGIAFTYFVNNRGFITSTVQPTYRSLNQIFPVMSGAVHDPRSQDLDGRVTHKIMYSLPDLSMPSSASGASPGGETWLVNSRVEIEIKNIQFSSVELDNYQFTRKGGYIRFETSHASNFRVRISSDSPDHPFVRRNITVNGRAGVNTVLWDGLDGAGNFLPVGEEYPIKVQVELLSDEVHFPYIDMEINPNGILISAFEEDYSSEEYAVVYWDDTDIPEGMPSENPVPKVNLGGISSSTNGHRFGTYRDQTIPSTSENNHNRNYGGFSYGNTMAMELFAVADGGNCSGDHCKRG